jgi:nitrite reductase/ring-hydroxylating ferredoxin subunit
MKSSEASMKTEIKEFTKVCRLDDLKDSEGKRFIINDVEVAVFKLNSEVFAVSNVCTHQHFNLIYDGFVEDECVICPVHGWKFDLKTGNKDSVSRGLASYPVEIADDYVYVKVNRNQLSW